jgi:hypothetical protein
MIESEKIDDLQLKLSHSSDTGCQSLKTSHIPTVAGMQMLGLVNKFSAFIGSPYSFVNEVNKIETGRLKDHDAVWKKAAGLNGDSGDDEESIKLVFMWSEMGL